MRKPRPQGLETVPYLTRLRDNIVNTHRRDVIKIKAYLTPAEAASYSGISISTLSKLRQRGTGCPYVRIGNSPTKAVVLYKRADLDQWLAEHKIKTIGGA